MDDQRRRNSTSTFPIQVRAQGWIRSIPVELSATILPEQADDWLASLREAGFRPRITFDLSADGVPICPKHAVPMAKREKQGDEWHSHKVRTADGRELFCRGYHGPDSPGFAAPASGD